MRADQRRTSGPEKPTRGSGAGRNDRSRSDASSTSALARLGELTPWPGACSPSAATAAAMAMSPLLFPRGLLQPRARRRVHRAGAGASLLWVGMSGHRLRVPLRGRHGPLHGGRRPRRARGPGPASDRSPSSRTSCCSSGAGQSRISARPPRDLRIAPRRLGLRGVVWAVLLFVGLMVGFPALTGQTTSEGSRTALTFGDPSYSANYLLRLDHDHLGDRSASPAAGRASPPTPSWSPGSCRRDRTAGSSRSSSGRRSPRWRASTAGGAAWPP